LRERFYSGDISIPNDEKLIAQLANIKFKYTSSGILIQKKEELRKKGKPSPDRADSLALCYMQANSQAFDEDTGGTVFSNFMESRI
jgi:hypothetical protein